MVNSKPKIKLKTINESAFMEDFLKISYLYNNSHNDLYFLSSNKEFDEQKTKFLLKKYKDILRNPKNYFNFNFNLNDFSKYIAKNLMMRCEKEIIKKKLEELRHYLFKLNTKKLNN